MLHKMSKWCSEGVVEIDVLIHVIYEHVEQLDINNEERDDILSALFVAEKKAKFLNGFHFGAVARERNAICKRMMEAGYES